MKAVEKTEYPTPVLDIVVQRITAVREYIPVLYLISEDRDIIYDLFKRKDCFDIRRKSDDGSWVSAEFNQNDSAINVTEIKTNSQFSSGFSNFGIGHSVQKEIGNKEPNIESYYYYRRDFALLSEEEQRKFIENYVNRIGGAEREKLVENLVLVSPVAPYHCIPKGFEQYVEVIDVPLIGMWEFSDLVVKKQNEVLQKLKKPTITLQEYIKTPDDYIMLLKGLNRQQVQHVLNQISDQFGWVTEKGLNSKERQHFRKDRLNDYARKLIREQKKQTVLKDGTVNFIPTEKMAEPGGMEGLRSWIKKKKKILKDPFQAEQYGVHFPRGVLIAGLPGSGKSMISKYIAHEFGDIPLIQFSLQNVMNGIVGGTEEKMDRALKLIEASAPCVVWIDEIEKDLAGTTGNGNSDSGIASRCLAKLLNWMQESSEQCFICATANNVQLLPSELLRRGRFDRKYYTFLPLQKQCEEIMVNQLKCFREYAPDYFEEEIDFKKLAKEVFDYIASLDRKFYTGADIEGVIDDAKSEIFNQNMTLPIKYADFKEKILIAVRNSQPYGETNYQDVVEYWLALKNHPFFNAAVPDDYSKTDRRREEIFSFSDFYSEGNRWKWAPDTKCLSDDPYDKKMFDSFRKSIEQYANSKK